MMKMMPVVMVVAMGGMMALLFTSGGGISGTNPTEATRSGFGTRVCCGCDTSSQPGATR